jgi:hypothetical protein
MPEATCAVDTCDRKRHARGWCRTHYERWLRTGDPFGSSVPDMPPDFPGEHWVPIPRWERIYEASTLGRIRSLDRIITCSSGPPRSLRGRILRPAVRVDGHLQVTLCRNGQDYKRYVHSLVALAFLGPRPSGLEACHGDGNPANNRPENLRYGSHGSNLLDRVRHGTHHQSNKTHCPWRHLLTAPNLVPSAAATGRRNCLACSRTRANAAKHKARHRGGTGFDFQAISDAHFARIMSA